MKEDEKVQKITDEAQILVNRINMIKDQNQVVFDRYFKDGFELACKMLDEYDAASLHPYRLGDCLRAKRNMINALDMRRNVNHEKVIDIVNNQVTATQSLYAHILGSAAALPDVSVAFQEEAIKETISITEEERMKRIQGSLHNPWNKNIVRLHHSYNDNIDGGVQAGLSDEGEVTLGEIYKEQ